MITKEQIKILQTLLGKQYRDREERLAFVSAFVGEEVASIKNLTPQQAFGLIRYLKDGQVAPASYYARFDAQNPQHRTLLARCHELGWVQEDNLKYVDLNRLGSFLISSRSPVKKALADMTSKEVSKIIFILEKMIQQRYERS